MAKIKAIRSMQILDSRGNPTIETTVELSDGISATAAVPSGASVSSYEALELRDKNPDHYQGMSVYTAIENIQSIIAPKIIGMDATKQQDIDRAMIELDGTQNKSRLGANALLAVSMAVCKAGAASSVLPLFLYLRYFVKRENEPLHIPTPLFNMINGGLHAGMNIDFQEFHIIPASSKPYITALETGVNIYHTLKKTLKENNLTTLVGDEGGYGPALQNNREALDYLQKSSEAAHAHMGYDAFLGLDVAANSFYREKSYHLKDRSMDYSTNDMIEYYLQLQKDYHLLYIEDPFAEDDWDGWVKLNSKIGQETLVVGDDLVSTNPYRLQMALDKKAISGVIIKPNQIGTVIETLAVVEIAKAAGLKVIVSHRSGETNDDFVSDFAVAVDADYLKFGAPARGERVSKLNRLSQIETHLLQINQTKK